MTTRQPTARRTTWRRALAAAVLAVATVVGGLLASASGAHAIAGVHAGGILNLGSADCLGGGGPGFSANPQDTIQEELVTCTDQDPQHWTAVPEAGGTYILEDGNGNCLGVKGASSGLGVPVEFEGCDPGPAQSAQEWTPLGATPENVNGSYQLVNANDGLCLGIFNAATALGSLAVQWTCQASEPNQQWFGPWIFGTVVNQGGIGTLTPNSAPGVSFSLFKGFIIVSPPEAAGSPAIV
jgi:hypothetical protein